MPAATTDKLKKYKSLFSTTLSTGIGTGTGDTITPSSVSGLPTDTLITLTFDRVDADGVATPSKLERIQGIISGGNFTSYTRGIDGTTEQAHSGGAVIEMIWNADDWNDMVDWGLTQHNQDGTHGAITSTNASMVTASMVTPTLNTPKVITSINDANGNEVMKTPATASAVNEVTITNAATGNAPEVSATGGDTNIDLYLKGKGSGRVKAYNGSSYVEVGAGAMTDAGAYVKPTTDGDEIRAYHSDGTSYVEVGNDGTDTKITSSKGHVVLTPETSKLVKIAVLERNSAGTDTYRNNAIILTGWTTTAGGGAGFFQASVTFGITFSTVPIVLCSPAGRDTTGTAPTTLDAHDEYNGYTTSDAVSISTTGFQTCLSACRTGADGAITLTNGCYFAVTWIAIGTLT